MDNITDHKIYECCICLKICKDAVTLSCCSQNYCDKCIRRSLLIKKECCVCRAEKSINDILPNENLIKTIKKMFPEDDNIENNEVDNDNTNKSNLVVKYTDEYLIGKIVKRGPDWNYGDLAVPPTCFGEIIKIGNNNKCVYVKWFNNYFNAYSIGHNNKYSLIYA
jgi:hypothetical protein